MLLQQNVLIKEKNLLLAYTR